MLWPHGDQAATLTHAPTLAVHESHEVGRPDTTLDTGELVYWLYSFRTIDEWGESRSAEW